MKSAFTFGPLLRDFFLLALIAVACSTSAVGAPPEQPYPTLHTIGSFTTPKPAYLALDTAPNGKNLALYVSTFGMFWSVTDSVSTVGDLSSVIVNPSSAKPKLLSKATVWPNETLRPPHGTFDRDVLLVPGGFLVPGKTGSVMWYEFDSHGAVTNTAKLTTNKSGWFYHRVELRDMNHDGRMDIVTARAIKPILPGFAPRGELIWLEQPTTWDHKSAWKEHHLVDGPDFNFRLVDIDRDGWFEIIATQFFTRSLNLYYRTPNGYASRVVDAELGSGFDLEAVDLNGDGQLDLLATNHEPNAQAAVVAYTFPTAFETAPWPKHALVTGIETRQPGINQASPGTAFAVRFDKTHRKPLIVVGGDGSQRVHVLTPASQEPTDWRYSDQVALDVPGSTIGRLAVGDVDGDTVPEVFVPAYDANRIFVLSFKSPR